MTKRQEFSKQVRRDAAARANGCCECRGRRLLFGEYHYDHDLPDALGGEATLANCRVLCRDCHKKKTVSKDVPTISKMKRQQAMALNLTPKPPSRWRRDFVPREPKQIDRGE